MTALMRTKDELIQVRVTKGQRQLFHRKAKRRGLSLSAWLVHMATVAPEKPPDRETESSAAAA